MRTEKRSARKRRKKYFLTRWKWIFFLLFSISLARLIQSFFPTLLCVVADTQPLSATTAWHLLIVDGRMWERKSGPARRKLLSIFRRKFLFGVCQTSLKNSSIFSMESIKLLEFVWPFPLHASTSLCHAICQFATSRTGFDDFGLCWGSSTLPNYVDFAAAACCACYKFKFVWKFSSCLALKLFFRLVGLIVTRMLTTTLDRCFCLIANATHGWLLYYVQKYQLYNKTI